MGIDNRDPEQPVGTMSGGERQSVVLEEAGHGVSTDLLSHSVDLAHLFVGPIERVVATGDTFTKRRPLVGPESQMAFEVYGTRGSLAWSLERMNKLRVHVHSEDRLSGYATVFGGERFPYHGNFAPGSERHRFRGCDRDRGP